MSPRRAWLIFAIYCVAVLVLSGTSALAGPLGDYVTAPDKAPTSLSLSASKTVVTYKKKAVFKARLTSGGQPLSNRKLKLFRGSDEAGWQQVSSASTNSKGYAKLEARASANAAYSATYSPTGAADTSAYNASESLGVEVKARPRIRVFFKGTGAGVVPGQRVYIRGSFRPVREGESVEVTITRSGREQRQGMVRVRNGRILTSYPVKLKGKYRVTAHYAGSDDLAAGHGGRNFRARYVALHQGSRGMAVRVLQKQLVKRHYWVRATGYYDGATSRAVMAFRKVTGMSRTFSVNDRVWQKIARGRGYFKLRYKRKGRYLEADLSRQVVVLARNGKVYRIVHTSSGTSATPTVQGTFNFYSHTPGYNAKSMYYSIYFYGGYAIHGFDPVPPYPASHGCLRIPIPNAVAVYNWVPNGAPITVYS